MCYARATGSPRRFSRRLILMLRVLWYQDQYQREMHRLEMELARAKQVCVEINCKQSLVQCKTVPEMRLIVFDFAACYYDPRCGMRYPVLA